MKKIDLIKLPTPLHRIEVDDKNAYYIKRDDLTDFALGGNKARKMEYFLADVKRSGSDYIVTYGSTQSNHCRIVAAAAARIGLKCLLILAGSEENFTYFGNDIMYVLSGANIKWCQVDEVSETIDSELNFLKQKGYKPYFIPGGGHGNLGTHSYVEAYREIREQADEMGITFDYIFLASGTGTTQAGLIVGKMLNSGDENIVGISIARNAKRGIEVIAESITSYCKEYDLTNTIDEQDILFEDSYIGEGYAHIYDKVAKTIRYMFVRNSIILDPVYTGKAFMGMCDYLSRKRLENKNIVFLHTGGVPIFFAKGPTLISMLD